MHVTYRIGQFAHGAVGFGSVEGQPALIAYGVDNQLCQLADSDFLARTDIDVTVADLAKAWDCATTTS